ncbi:dockerin type I domain-containing protein [Ruminococcus sp.]
MKKSKRWISLVLVGILSTMSVSSALIVNAEEQNEYELQPAEKITAQLTDEINSSAVSDAKIPVYIWYKDIDFDKVDTRTAKETGLTPADCEVITDFPLATTLYGLENDEQQAEAEMEQYLVRTQEARAIEKERTNTYKSARKEIAREEYDEKSSTVKSKLSLNENDIIFSSQYAPMIIANMTPEEIDNASKLSVVEEIGYYEEPTIENPSVDKDEGVSAKESMGLTKVYEKLGLSGKNVNVGLIEFNIPGIYGDEELEFNLDDITIVETPNHKIITDNPKDHEHPNNTCRIMAGVQTGIAKDIKIYATNANFSNIEALLECNLDIIEVNGAYLIYERYHEDRNPNSIGDIKPNYDYNLYDKYYDHIISQHNISTVIAGGNYGDHENDWFDENYEHDDGTRGQWIVGPRVTSPGMAYNAITVGGYANNNTGDNPDDDWLINYGWKNKYENKIGCEKPDVIMSDNFPGGGTSSASPALTAEIALMLELKPSLSLHPQEIKAIVLASCHRKVKQTDEQGGQETMEQGITERQGAGAPDAWTMASIISQGTYGSGILKGTETNVDIVQPCYDAQKMNVSITWIKENTAKVIEHPEDPRKNEADITLGQTSDLNLNILQNNEIISKSSLTNSSTEMCYFPMSTTDFKYRLNIKQNSSPTKVRYGYAWSTDNMLSSSVEQSGIYYLKNASTENYMLYNSSNTSHISARNITSQNKLTDTANWIIAKSSNGYTIKTGYNSIDGYLSEDTASGGLIVSSDAVNVDITKNNDGTYCIKNVANGKILCYNNSKFMWLNCDAETDTSSLRYRWYFNKINYLPGDVNVDGTIDVSDVVSLQKYLAGTSDFNNKEMFLSDVNKDGIIDLRDVTALQIYISQMGK